MEVGDSLFLRNDSGEITWVADVLRIETTGGPQAWGKEEAQQPYLVAGWLARIHPGTLTPGRAKLAAPWVTLNSRTLMTALPWHEGGNLVYHHTMHLVEGVVSDEELEQAQALGIVVQHRSGHWLFPMGDARKRFLVQIRREPLVCALCGAPIASLEESTQDHRIPSSQGGPDVLGNLQLAHKVCNEVKGNALPEQYPPLFSPPGQETGRYNPRRSRHRSSRTPLVVPAAFGSELAAPAAVNGNGHAAAGLLVTPARPAAPAAVGASRPAARLENQTQASPAPETKAARARTSPHKGRAAAADDAAQPAAPTDAAAKKPARRTRRSPAKKAEAKAAAEVPAEVPAASASPVVTAAAATAAAPAVARPAEPVDAVASSAADAPAAVTPVAGEAAPAAAREGAAEAQATAPEGLSAPEEWLKSVQSAGWRELAQMASGPEWAARTATLRTMCALRRNQAQQAASQGVLVAERTGKEGRFALHTWKDQHILVEEKGSRRHVHQVHMLQGLSPEAYVWYLSEYGRTAPLTVAMALMPLWLTGTPDESGRITAKKGSQRLVLTVLDNRLVDCSRGPSGTAVA
ncbi:MAG: HNH endonuclease [Bacillota bacterium]